MRLEVLQLSILIVYFNSLKIFSSLKNAKFSVPYFHDTLPKMLMSDNNCTPAMIHVVANRNT